MRNLHYEKFADGSVKCIEDEIPFELPDGWLWVRLNSIADMALGKMLDVAKNKGSLKTYLRNINVRWGAFDLSDTLEMRFEDNELERYSINYGDLVICEGGEPGRCAVWQSEEVVFYQKALHRVRAIQVLPEYLYYVIRHFIVSSQYERYYTGTTIKHLTGQSLRILPIPLPPLREQKLIVEHLQHIIKEIDKIETGKAEVLSLVSLAKEKILDLAIRGQLVPQNPADEPASVLLERIRSEKEELIQQGKIKRDKKESVIFRGEDNSYYAMIDGVSVDIAEYLGFDLPDGWIWITLKDIATLTSGKTPKPDQLSPNGSVPYFKVADMNTPGNELYLRHADCYINDLYSGPVYDGGSFVFPKNGGAVLTNKKRILTNASVVDLNTGVFTPSKLLNQDFIFFLFSSIDFSKIHKGAVIPTVDSSVIGNLIYGLPPIEEQKRIANIIKSLFAQVEQIDMALF